MADSDSKPYGVIYCVEHRESGKLYVGQTTGTIAHRWYQHCYYADTRRCLGNAIRKYGKLAFDVFELDLAFAKDDLDALEIFYITFFRSSDRSFGYNLDSGGGSGKHSEETKSLISKLKMGHVVSDSARMKISLSQIGRRPTDETRLKLSAVRIGKTRPKEIGEKISAKLTGRKYSEDRIARMSVAGKIRFRDPEIRRKFLEMVASTTNNDVVKNKISESAKQQWSNPVGRKKLLDARARTQVAGNAARTGAWRDPVKKAARLEKLAATWAKKAAQI